MGKEDRVAGRVDVYRRDREGKETEEKREARDEFAASRGRGAEREGASCLR